MSKTVVLVSVIIIILTSAGMAFAILAAGDSPPDFSLKDPSGRVTTLSGMPQHKAVVILFWSTWSANSSKALKRFKEFYDKYKDKGIGVIAINADNQTITDEDMLGINKVIGELGITFPVLMDNGLKTFRGYDVIALPSTVVISEGKVAYSMPGFPLMGVEDMFDYLLVLAGEKLPVKTGPEYTPRYDAVADANLAGQFVKRKMYPPAVQYFKKAIEKDPGYIKPYMELAKTHILDEKPAEAEAVLRKVLSIKPEYADAMSELGHLLSRTGRVEEAVEALSRAVKISSHPSAYYYLAYALAKKGLTAEALKTFDQAISLNPYASEAFILRAEVYEDAKKIKEASADYKRALQLLLNVK